MEDLVRVRAEVLERILQEARRDPSVECCGLLAGREGVITAIFPAANQLRSVVAFEIAPEELFRIFREMRATGLDHLGIYHSHPSGENVPSRRDIERAFYPDVAYVVVSPRPEAAQPMRAFSICEGRVRELRIQRVEPTRTPQ